MVLGREPSVQGDIIRILRRPAWPVIIVFCMDREGLSEMIKQEGSSSKGTCYANLVT